ncbi:MAG: hypothetical protein Q9183_005523, partial [Haloplaca sp. 2 TL-2023]
GFDSPIVTINVGKQEKTMTAHIEHLAQSPVFQTMLDSKSRFKEAATLHVSLPDEDPIVIKAMLQYLYSGDFRDITNHDSTSGIVKNADDMDGDDAQDQRRAETALFLAKMYVAAEKFHLPDLKALVIEKIASITNLAAHPISFLQSSMRIYSGIPEDANVEDPYRTFFKSTAIELEPSKMSPGVLTAYESCLAFGSMLAVDLANAIHNNYEFRTSETRERHDAALRKLEKERDGLVAWKEGAMRVHRLFHNPCTCDCVGEVDGMGSLGGGGGS